MNLLDDNFKYKLTNIIIVCLGVILSFITGFTGLVVGGIKFMGVFLIRLQYGPWMLPFLVIITLIIVATLHPLLKEYYSKTVKERHKQEYFLAGIIIFYTANIIFNITLPIIFDITRFYFIGDYSTILLLGFTAYAIVKHELMGIKTLLTQAIIIVISVILLIDVFFLSYYRTI